MVGSGRLIESIRYVEVKVKLITRNGANKSSGCHNARSNTSPQDNYQLQLLNQSKAIYQNNNNDLRRKGIRHFSHALGFAFPTSHRRPGNSELFWIH